MHANFWHPTGEIGVRADGRKELVALADGYRESAESRADLLRDPVWTTRLVLQAIKAPKDLRRDALGVLRLRRQQCRVVV